LKLIDDKSVLRKAFADCKDGGEMTPALSAEFMNHASKLSKDSDVVVDVVVVEEPVEATT
jgi:hypothetical protein